MASEQDRGEQDGDPPWRYGHPATACGGNDQPTVRASQVSWMSGHPQPIQPSRLRQYDLAMPFLVGHRINNLVYKSVIRDE